MVEVNLYGFFILRVVHIILEGTTKIMAKSKISKLRYIPTNCTLNS